MHQATANETKSSTHTVKSTSRHEPNKEEIRIRAHQIYLSRNRKQGHELDDWLQAERELLARN
ncbi:MAG: DUF2934 domain-containing protein [Candidatus Acidiferrales bacterium]